MKYGRFFLIICVFAIVSSTFAQKTMEKPFSTWSRDESIKILSDSSWATMYRSNVGTASADAANAARNQADNRLAGAERGRSERSGGPAPVVIRLHSALPVRQALTRLNQIAAGYDKMNEKGKADFDESARKLLDCAICQGYYVVTITQVPNPSGQFVEEAIFQGMTHEEMKGNIWLENDKDEKRELFQYIMPQKRGDSAVFFFPRKDEKGSIFLTSDNKDFSFVFKPTFLTANNRYAHLVPRKFDFKLSKITVGENLMF